MDVESCDIWCFDRNDTDAALTPGESLVLSLEMLLTQLRRADVVLTGRLRVLPLLAFAKEDDFTALLELLGQRVQLDWLMQRGDRDWYDYQRTLGMSITAVEYMYSKGYTERMTRLFRAYVRPTTVTLRISELILSVSVAKILCDALQRGVVDARKTVITYTQMSRTVLQDLLQYIIGAAGYVRVSRTGMRGDQPCVNLVSDLRAFHYQEHDCGCNDYITCLRREGRSGLFSFLRLTPEEFVEYPWCGPIYVPYPFPLPPPPIVM